MLSDEKTFVDNRVLPRRQSLRWRLSALFAIAAVLTVGTFGVFAYSVAYTSALDSAKARVRSVVVQIKTIVDLGLVNQLDSLAEAAGDADVIAALLPDNLDRLVLAEARLRRLQGTAGDAVIVELLDAAGERVLVLPSDAAPLSHLPQMLDWSAPMIGPLSQQGQTTRFAAGAPVMAAGQRLGHVIVTRHLGVGNANRRIVVNQLGEHGALLIGNQGGPLWDPKTTVHYPGAPDQPAVYERDGRRWVSVSAAVGQTSWLYAVELPEAVAVADARALILPVGLIGLIIALAAAGVGARVSRRITTPLEALTAAAESIACGGRNVALVGMDRADEIGRLARAFDTMLASVRTVRDQLEADVDARTSELTEAITRLRQLDDRLHKSERLAILGRLSGSVGHELRNPLGVMNTVSVLIDGLPDASPKLKGYASLLREQIRLSERLISDMLDRARSGAPQLGPVDIRSLLDEIVDYAGAPDSIVIDRQLAANLPCVVVDRDHVRQIVWNLISNGVQAMGAEPGTLTITATYSGGRLAIEVRDSGPGVPVGAVDRIFEPMFTTRSDGVGLGLAISRALARASGGDLSVRNPGAPGAAFTLDLPAAVCGAAGDRP